MVKVNKKAKKDYVYASGKRRTASARARIYRGKGELTINGKSIEKYIPGVLYKDIFTKPFRIVDAGDKYYETVRVRGGGVIGQVEAAAHAIAKALAKVEKENFRPLLKSAGLLSRDSRIRQRRNVGMGGKSRRQKQSPKR